MVLTLVKDDPQGEFLVFCLENIKGVVFLAEGHNGAGAESVALSGGDGDALLVEGDHTIEAVSHLKHEAGLRDGLDLDIPLCRIDPFAGLDGVFDGIGQHRGEFRFICRQGIREGQPGAHPDMFAPCPF